MAIEVGDILRIAAEWVVDLSDQVVNVHTFEVLDLGLTTTDLEVMEDIAASSLFDLYDIINGVMVNNCTGTFLRGLNLTKNEVLPVVGWNLDGTATFASGAARPVTALVYLNADTPRRQARNYLPPFAGDNIQDDGFWATSLLPGLAVFAAALSLPLIGDEVDILRVIGSSIATGFLEPTVAGFSTAPRTQRRRTPGRGA